jgi:hypothetical protein
MSIGSSATIAALIDGWLAARLDAPAAASAKAWLAAALSAIAQGDQKTLGLAWGLAPRKVGKAEFALSPAELQRTDKNLPGWHPQAWSLDQLVRARLLLAIPAADATAWLAAIDRLAAASDLGEQVALYQSLALLPHPELLRLRAAEGVRTNAGPVFAAIALDNPYPAAHLDDAAWNQLVLKAIFTDRPLERIVGLSARANLALAHMIVNLAHERQSAGRSLPPGAAELVAPFVAREAALADGLVIVRRIARVAETART